MFVGAAFMYSKPRAIAPSCRCAAPERGIGIVQLIGKIAQTLCSPCTGRHRCPPFFTRAIRVVGDRMGTKRFGFENLHRSKMCMRGSRLRTATTELHDQ